MGKTIINLILSILSALLLTLSFPTYDIELFAWIGIIPIFYIINRNNLKNTLLWSWFTGTIFFFITINWLTETMKNYGGMPTWISLLTLILLSLYLGLYFGLFGLLTKLIMGRISLPLPFIAPPLWISLEYLRGHLLTGFPWASLGYSQYKFLHIIQITDITSFLGVSFLIVGVNSALFEILSYFEGRRKRYIRPSTFAISISFIALLFILSLTYGYYKLQTTYNNPDRGMKIAVLQGNIPQHLKWDRKFQRKTIDTYKGLTDVASREGTDLVIWPETAAPFFFQERTGYQQEIYDLASKNDTFLLFGSPSYTLIDNSFDTIKLFNSAYLASPHGETLARYDKIHLVPFGEYVPLSNILFFIEKMVVGIGDFIPGRDYTVFQVPRGKFGVVICFEVIFPDLVRRFVLNGAEFMTTITNDAWFGKSAAPYQHFSMVVFRAIENRVYFARAANTGISGFISPKGEILGATPIFVEGYQVQKISPTTVKTFYTLYGDVFAYISIFFTTLFLLLSMFRRKK